MRDKLQLHIVGLWSCDVVRSGDTLYLLQYNKHTSHTFIYWGAYIYWRPTMCSLWCFLLLGTLWTSCKFFLQNKSSYVYCHLTSCSFSWCTVSIIILTDILSVKSQINETHISMWKWSTSSLTWVVKKYIFAVKVLCFMFLFCSCELPEFCRIPEWHRHRHRRRKCGSILFFYW